MGGPVSIVVREPLGKVKAYEAWTGGIPGICHCNRLYDDDPRVTEFLDHWYDGATGDVSPDGYGLVLIDRMKKVILTCQGYCDPIKIIGSGILNEVDGNVVRMGADDDDDRGDAINFTEAFWAGRIKHIEVWNREKGDHEPLDCSRFKTPTELLDWGRENKFVWWNIVLDIEPYTIEYFEEDSKGLEKLRARVVELGFNLTEVETQYWDQYINDRKECEDED